MSGLVVTHGLRGDLAGCLLMCAVVDDECSVKKTGGTAARGKEEEGQNEERTTEACTKLCVCVCILLAWQSIKGRCVCNDRMDEERIRHKREKSKYPSLSTNPRELASVTICVFEESCEGCFMFGAFLFFV